MTDQDRIALVLSDDNIADIIELLIDVLGAVSDIGGIEGIDSLAQEANPAHDVRLAAQGEDVATHIRIRLLDRVLHLLERDAVVIELHRINQHLVLLDSTAEPCNVDHARHGL